MKRHYRHIALWLYLPSLLLSTGGFNIHTLYCLCKGETAVSLFYIPDQCAEKAETPASCCTKSHACAKPAADAGIAAAPQHDCSTHGLTFAKLNTPFLISADEPHHAPAFSGMIVPPVCQFAWVTLVFEQEDFLPHYHAPPPPSGMDLRRFLKSYRC